MLKIRSYKKILCIIVILLIIGSAFGYWLYWDYKFEKNPQFYYKSRTTTP